MIPDYQTLMRPVLESAMQGERKISDVVEDMADLFELTEDERAQKLPSGKQTAIANRVHWARFELKQAGLLKNTRRGWFEITENGRVVLGDTNVKVDSWFLRQLKSLELGGNSTSPDIESAQSDQIVNSPTPDENLQEAHQRLDAALAASLLDSVREASPAFFEELIVELFIAMGYGSTSEDAGRALGQTGDNGVDGVIDQDPLGVDQIYLQAKRYGAGNSIGSGHIRDFFGALSLKKASKGIFVTTSTFTASATQTARDLGSRIVLIDGAQLARLMIRYGIGCRTKDTLYIKEIDEGYFEAE